MLILSPHIDDAGFSLGITLAKAQQASVAMRIVNFFTVSGYTTSQFHEGVSEVSAARKEEEREVCSLLNKKVQLSFLELTDAPLREEFIRRGYYRPEGLLSDDLQALTAACNAIRKLYTNQLAFVPLGLGDHIDHSIVHRAATEVIDPQSLIFYEDQPYGGRMEEAEILHHVMNVQARLRIRLVPSIVRVSEAWKIKKQLIACYASQLDEATQQEIRQAVEKYKGGERIWINDHQRKNPELFLLRDE